MARSHSHTPIPPHPHTTNSQSPIPSLQSPLPNHLLSRFLLIALALTFHPTYAQISETFDDGELGANPSWAGEYDQWQFLPNAGGLALFTNGLAQSDTLFLTTESTATAGSWSFDVGYRNGLLSSFNLIRIYLMAADKDLKVPVDGYYLQLGTNDRDVRLYRSSTGGSRTLLVQHATELLLVDQQAFYIEIKRTTDRLWEIYLDGRLIACIEEESAVYESRFFGLWVKHTASRGQDVWFDNLAVVPDTTRPDPVPPSPYPPPEPGDLIVNEIFFAPPENDLEFVEILNRSSRSQDLCAVSLADSQTDPIQTCSGVRPLAPGEYRVLARDSSRLVSVFPGSSPLSPPTWPALNNGGDAVRLYTSGFLLEEVVYQPSWGGQGVSLERRDPSGPANASFNWGSSRDPAGATPGRLNSLYAPDTTPPTLVFVELTGPRSITAIWNEPIEPPFPAAFRAGSSPAESVELLDVSSISLRFPDDVVAFELTAFGIGDATGNIRNEESFPIAFKPTGGQLLLSEIMFEPRATPFDGFPDQPEYVELYNISERLLSFRGLVITGQVDDYGVADTLRSAALYPTLKPGGYALFYADDGTDMLREAFPSLTAISEPLSLLPIAASSLRLLNTGGIVRISTAGSTMLDEAVYTPDQHHPNLAETRGISLERRSFAVEATHAGNWSSSTAEEGGTPGRTNSILNRKPGEAADARLRLSSEVFSPDGDGIDDVLIIDVASSTAPQMISLRIFDVNGRLVRTLSNGTLAGNTSQFFWDGRTDGGRLLPVGIYIVFLEMTDIERGKRERFKKTAVLAWPAG